MGYNGNRPSFLLMNHAMPFHDTLGLRLVASCFLFALAMPHPVSPAQIVNGVPSAIGGPPPLPPGATLVPPRQSSPGAISGQSSYGAAPDITSQRLIPPGSINQNAFVEESASDAFDSRSGGTFIEPPTELRRLISDGGVQHRWINCVRCSGNNKMSPRRPKHARSVCKLDRLKVAA